MTPDRCIDITWYRHLSEADENTLCAVVRSPPPPPPPKCCAIGKRGRVTLLLKHPVQPVPEANLRGITVPPHISN